MAFGFEGAPGHQTSGDRGFGRSADGGGTYGGSGWYCAEIGGLWDALLGEGRNWWNFASSDFHWHWARGGSDFWPGEYQKNYIYIDKDRDPRKAVVKGLRSGNSFHVEGDLIDKLVFTASADDDDEDAVIMGQTLAVEAGDEVTVRIRVRDPKGTNHCPLNMMNPSLQQIGVDVPLNMPVLDHIDLIVGDVTGYVDPKDPDYANATNPTAAVMATFDRDSWKAKRNGMIVVQYKFVAEKDQYLRLRGTNLPADLPHETDLFGNPLADFEASDNLYALMDPEELETKLFDGIEIMTNSKLDEVAEAYADLWFYSNPIFIDVEEDDDQDDNDDRDDD